MIEPSQPNRRWADAALLWVGLACWAAGLMWAWSRPSLWILDLLVVPLMLLLFLGGLAAVLVAAVRRRPAALVVAPVVLALTLAVNPGWMLTPRAWFHLHRPLFEAALDTDPGDGYYGAELPAALRFLTVDGKVSNRHGWRFFPQWIGVPDDAGGYLYGAGKSPAGVDLYGMICGHPVNLGGGWWMCGLRDNGF